MTGLWLSTKRSTQPQGPAEIDRGNPLTRNLVGLLVAGSYNSMRAVSGINGNRGYGAEGHGKRITPAGIFQTALGAGYGDELVFPTPRNFDEGYFGFVLFYQRAGASGYLFEQNAPSNHNDGRIILNSNATLTCSANADFSFTSNAVSDGLHTVVLANHRKAAVQKVWLDGVLIASGTSSSNLGFTSTQFLTLVSSVAPLAVGLCGSSLGNAVQAEQFAQAFSVNPWQLLAQRPRAMGLGATTVSLPTLGRPVSDTSTGQWSPSTGSTLSAVLNEAVASDTDFISVAAFSSCEVLLTQTSYPGTAEQTISYRASSPTGNGLSVTLTQNGTPIASWSHALSSTVTTYTQTLTAAQIALIGPGALSVILTST